MFCRWVVCNPRLLVSRFALARPPRLLSLRRTMFEEFISRANHLGLFAEEMTAAGEALGNFPQAFTHIGYIKCAMELTASIDA